MMLRGLSSIPLCCDPGRNQLMTFYAPPANIGANVIYEYFGTDWKNILKTPKDSIVYQPVI